ncbi:MAG: universal stress protein [Rubrivivax sp.]|nr:universal stress protein [Rubrivivax sp.]
MKILVAVDGSSYTKRMLGYLAAHDEWLGGAHEYSILHSVPAVPPRAAAVIDKQTLKAYYDDEAEKVFKPIRSFFGKKPSLKIAYLAKPGAAADNIAQIAEKGDFDMIIMGSHGHSTLANLVMGSVATKVLAHCKVPVLLIR